MTGPADPEEILSCKNALFERCGKVVFGPALWTLLGKGAASTLRTAIRRGEFSELTFWPIPGQRGRCLLTADLAKFLVNNGINWQSRLAKVPPNLGSPSRKRRPQMSAQTPKK